MIYGFLCLLSGILRCLPLGWVCALGRVAGRLLFVLDRWHVRLAMSNLQVAFPQMLACDRARIAKQLFINLGEGSLEFLTYRNAMGDRVLATLDVRRGDIARRVLARGKGLILFTAHYGHWELIGLLGPTDLRDHACCAIGRTFNHKGLERFIHEIRETCGLRILPKAGALREVLKRLRKGQVACFLADQIAGAEGVMVNFFDRPTWSIATPATLSLKTGAAIVPAFIERTGVGSHRITYCDPIEPIRTGNGQMDVTQMTQRAMSTLEEFVRRRPDHWFWIHKRWKSKKAKKNFQDTNRIVVFSPHWIGDAVMSLPAQVALRKLFPNAYLAIAYPHGLKPIYRGCTHADQHVPYGWTAQGFGMKARRNLVQQLRADGYDMAVLFPNSLDSALLAWASGIRHRVGYRAHGRSLLLTYGISMKGTSALHQSMKYQALVNVLGDVPTQTLPKFHIAEEDRYWVSNFLGFEQDKPLVALHPGATYGPTKRWFPERFVALAQALHDRGDVRVVFLGSEKEYAALEPYRKGRTLPVLDAMGKTDLGKLLALIARSDVLIANDSGPMHLASLLGIPTVAIFGSTEPVATGPMGPHRLVRKPLACSPCLKRICANPNLYECLDAIAVSDVLRQVGELLPRKAHCS